MRQFSEFLRGVSFRWTLISIAVGALAAVASAAFLISLEWVTRWRETHPWIIVLLPVAGGTMAFIYHRYGKSVEAGSNLILDEVHQPQSVLPLRMAPFVLVGSVITHLFGGSAGREGTAIQMGGSLADQVGRLFRILTKDRPILLMAGMSAGFASVFGTPWAGTFFGIEVLAIGAMRYDALFPCLIAAFVGSYMTTRLGIRHLSYPFLSTFPVSLSQLVYVVFAGGIFGLVGMGFARATHGVSQLYKRCLAYPPLRPVVGGAIVISIMGALHTTRYCGLGIPVILQAFSTPLPLRDAALKFLLTVLTLGAGFKGGEVTPLFFIGAALGNSLSQWVPLALPLLAAMGFTAVFAGAANIPLACTLMGIELFGHAAALPIGIACLVSYLCSGHAGIYASQRISRRKFAAR